MRNLRLKSYSDLSIVRETRPDVLLRSVSEEEGNTRGRKPDQRHDKNYCRLDASSGLERHKAGSEEDLVSKPSELYKISVLNMLLVFPPKGLGLKSYEHGSKNNLLAFENMKSSYIYLLKSVVAVTYVHKFDPPSKRWKLFSAPHEFGQSWQLSFKQIKCIRPTTSKTRT